MVYETLITATVLKSSPKADYTPAGAFKKALKTLRKIFSSSSRHQMLHNESSLLDSTNIQEAPVADNATVLVSCNRVLTVNDLLEDLSAEERENYENERLEAEGFATGIDTIDAVVLAVTDCE